ncbi:uncharacterized protein LOC134785989 [Penaeus indicus]|uniref:uncharacterized protein LOC134785989 n=1 Tax=Penaeus indicus TaxID=29960 RepID=UPI00300C15B6
MVLSSLANGLKMEQSQPRTPFPSSRADPGLSLLVPLYHFLQNTCREVVHKILVYGFRSSLFIQESLSSQYASKPKARVTVNTPLHCLLYQIQELGNSQEQKRKRKGANGGKGKQQGECHGPKRNHLLQDIKKNEGVLSHVTVQDLLTPSKEVFEKLKHLDLIFVINLITNDILHYQFSDSVLASLLKLKEIRTNLFHSRFHFSIEEFDDKLNLLNELVCTLCEYLGYSPENLKEIGYQFLMCREQAKSSPHKPADIFDELVREVHQCYAPTRCYVIPNIINQSNSHVIEDLGRLVSNQKNLTSSSGKQPILLCGPCGSGKTTILQNLAHSLSQENQAAEGRPSLVLHLRECSSWNKVSVGRRKETENFWEKVYSSIRKLAPNTVNRYGLEVVSIVINLYIDDTVFLVDWELEILDKLCSDIQRGTWVLAYQKTHFHSPDWCILTVEAFEEANVLQFLEKYDRLHHTNVRSQYKEYDDYRNILTSPELINIFCEVNSKLIVDSDFEMINYFVEKKLRRHCSNNITKLYELAFVSICKRRSFTGKDIIGIGDELCKLFLVEYMPECYRFIHQIVQDFLAARYVVHNPNKACKDWLDNVQIFKRVFKFVCSTWSQDKRTLRDNIDHIQNYLVTLFSIEKKKKGKSHKNHSSSGSVEPMCVDEESGKEKKKRKHKTIFENPVKDPFTEWDFLIQLDDACSGQKECLRLFAELLSCIPCWEFKVDALDRRKLKRIEKILKKVKLNDRSPVVIRLECLINTSLLIELWNILKNIEGLHHRAHVKIRIKRDKVKDLEPVKLAEIPETIAEADCAFYIKDFEGPLFCSNIPDFFKCRSFQKLEYIDVSVYDIATLKQVLLCDKLPAMQSATVKLFLKTVDPSVSHLNLPQFMGLKFIMEYFPEIQHLINRLKYPHYLSSLSIHNIYVLDNFKLDLSPFNNLKTLYLICKPNQDDQAGSYDASAESPEPMSVDNSVLETCPRSNWMLVMMMNLILPPKLERLMFRNMDFYNDSNNYLLLNIFRKCNVERIMILDSHLTLRGVRKVMISLTTNFDSLEQLESMTKKMRMERGNAIEAITVFAKQPRLSKELRVRRQKNKPPGKELIITSNAGLCVACQSFPCICKLQEFEDKRETLKDLICLIEDIYYFDILSFSFVSNLFTVRKDLYGDLRVACTLTELTDASLIMIDPSDMLFQLFYRLAVAQSIFLKLTRLTQEGIIALINLLKENKKSVSGGLLEPFSVTVGSAYHYAGESNMKTFFKFLLNEKCLASFNFSCTCEDKCYWIKKTYGGQIFYNNKLQNTSDLEESQS